ncbi:MAG: hypothetical protein AABY22_32675 [Nanoarchaeota archaeon]
MKYLDKKAKFFGQGIEVKFEKETPTLALPLVFLINSIIFFVWVFISILVAIILYFEIDKLVKKQHRLIKQGWKKANK